MFSNTAFISGIVVAAGQGKRLGLGIPKQFLKIKGQPLLAYTIDNLLKIGILNELIVVVSDDRINSKELKACLPLPSSVPIKIIAGGEHRQDSVFNGMQ
ncbi:MAG: NTP transferase domain-containing protein, partial [Candidatus Marinimicrobia bacterium]|nr:NTP transferase domain-containing protein [Candidatus Neomarinimicrobiota bacterium]